MVLQTEDFSIQTLVKLGLTVLQAKIYLTTVIVQKAGVAKLSAMSKVARPDVYRVLPTLEKMGLVRKIIASPTMYEATPLKQGCELLLQSKKSEYLQIRQDTLSLIHDFYEKHIKSQDVPNNDFVLISSASLLLEKFQMENAIAKNNIDVAGHWLAVRPLVFGYNKIFQQALKRGIKIRVVTEKPSAEQLCDIVKNPLLEIRFLDTCVPIKAVVYDGKRASMCVGELSSNEIIPSLWSDNSEFGKVVLAYFEKAWSNANPAVIQSK